MSILLCVPIAWVTFCLLLVGLILISLLSVERASDTSQVTIDDEGCSGQAPQMAKFDRAMDEPVQKARALDDACDACARLVGMALVPRDASPTAQSAVARRIPRTGAVIIRDPRLTRARTLSDQSGVGLNATFVFPTACGGRDTAA